MHNAHKIQNGLYARKNTSAHRLDGLEASHRLLLPFCTAVKTSQQGEGGVAV